MEGTQEFMYSTSFFSGMSAFLGLMEGQMDEQD